MKKVPRQKPFSKMLLNSMAEVPNCIPDEVKVEKPHLFKKNTDEEKTSEDKESEPIKSIKHNKIK